MSRAIRDSEVEGLKSIPPLSEMPPQAAASFLSEDQSTALFNGVRSVNGKR